LNPIEQITCSEDRAHPACHRQVGVRRLSSLRNGIILDEPRQEAAMTTAMTRRALLAGSTALLANRAASAQPATTLKLYSAVYEVEAEMLAFQVQERTEGRYRIEQIIGFERITDALGAERAAGGEQALLDGVHKGDLDLTTIASVSAVEHFPQIQVFDFPFVFRDYSHARAVLDGSIGRDLLAKTLSSGALALAWSENGFRHVTNNEHPVRNPEDMKGLKIRTPKSPVMIEAFRALGAEVTPTPWSEEIFDMLARGVLNAQENTINTIWATRTFKLQKNLSLTGHIYSPATIFMSRAVYDKLSDSDRQAFVDSARLAGDLKRKSIDDSEGRAIAQLLDVGMQINMDVDKSAFRAALAPAYAVWRRQFGDLIERIQAQT
jgi:TRAP-type transport system periplasmic protein